MSKESTQMRRFLAVPLVGAATLVLVALPANAHEEISPSTVPVGRPVFLTLTAANERSVDLTGVSVTAPEGLRLGTTTRQPGGWAVQVSEREVSWTGATVAPRTFEDWGFEIEAVDQPGQLTFRATSRFANGATDTHEVVVTAVSGGDNPVVSSSPAATTTTVGPGGSPTTQPLPTIPVAKPTSGEATAATALVFAIVAGLLGAAALIVAIRKQPGHSTATPGQKGENW